MIRCIVVLLLTTLLQSCLHTQSVDMKNYNGGWESFLPSRIFTHDVSLIMQADGEWRVKMANPQPFYDKVIPSTSTSGIELALDEQLHFKGELNQDGSQISGYLQQMDTKFHLVFQRMQNAHFKAQWRTFYVTDLQPERLYLAVENGQGDDYEAYPILPDNRYRGTYADYFKKEGDRIEFIDRRVGYRFRGQLKSDEISLEVFLGQAKVGTLNFTPTTGNWDMGTTAVSKKASYTEPVAKEDGWETAPLSGVANKLELLDRMADSIEASSLTHVHSVLMAHKGKLVYEHYFNGFHADLPHDQRSAAKSIGSAMIGIALEDGVLSSVHDPVYKYLPKAYQYTKDDQKAKISLEHLLTMSSGLDAIDFGSNRQGKATEDYYQETDNWLETVLTAPMLFEPGAHCNYGSANPFLLSVALSESLDIPLEQYMHDRLLGPLGMSNYSIPLDRAQRPYFGGGMYVIPRDMLKFGELYRMGGVWKGQRLISQAWVDQSFQQYAVLENTDTKNGYGYLFWHETYQVGDSAIKAVEARGAGGQYISIIPELELVLVITSGNYRNGRYWQPEKIIEEYLLPVFAE